MNRFLGMLIFILKLPIDFFFIALPFLIVFVWTDISPLWLIVFCPIIIGPGLTIVHAIEGVILKYSLAEEAQMMEQENSKQFKEEPKINALTDTNIQTKDISIKEQPETNVFSTDEFYKILTDKKYDETAEKFAATEPYLKFCKLPDDLRSIDEYPFWADDPTLRAYCICMVFGFICCGSEPTEEAEEEGFIIYMSIVPIMIKKIADNHKNISKELFYSAIFKSYASIRYFCKSSPKQSYSTYMWIISWFRVRLKEQNTIMTALNSLLDLFFDQNKLESKFGVSLSDYSGIRKRYSFVIEAIHGDKDDFIFPNRVK